MRTSERDLHELIEQALSNRKMSAIQAANAAGLNREAIRSVLRGRSPTYGRLVELCDAVGLDLIIRYRGSQKDEGPKGAAAPAPATDQDTLDSFTTTQQLSVRAATEHGTWKAHIDYGEAPAPLGLLDPQAFYVIADDESLAPTGIRKGDHVLVSPNARITRDTRIWLRRTDGRESLRWLAHWWAAGFETLYWGPGSSDGNRPDLNAEQMRPADISRQGAILAAYGGEPSAKRPPVQRGAWP